MDGARKVLLDMDQCLFQHVQGLEEVQGCGLGVLPETGTGQIIVAGPVHFNDLSYLLKAKIEPTPSKCSWF